MAAAHAAISAWSTRGGGGGHAVHAEVDGVTRAGPILEQEAGADISTKDRGGVTLASGLAARQIGSSKSAVSDFDTARDVGRGDSHASRATDIRGDLMAETAAAFLDHELTKGGGEGGVGDHEAVRSDTAALDRELEPSAIDHRGVTREGTRQAVRIAEVGVEGADDERRTIHGSAGVDKRICEQLDVRRLTRAVGVSQGAGHVALGIDEASS